MSWAVVPLPEVVYFQEGPGVRAWEFTSKGFPLMNIGLMREDGTLDKSDCRFVSEEIACGKWRHFQLDANDIVVASSGSLGKRVWVRGADLPLMLNTSVMRFRALDGARLDQRYLWHFLGSTLFSAQYNSLRTGTAQLNFGPSHLRQMHIPLPPLPEQRRIADMLDKADAIRRKRKEAIALTEELLRSAFLEMFGDPVSNPKGWEVKPLGEIAEVNRGKFTPRPRNDPRFYGGQHAFIQTGELRRASGYLRTWRQTLNEEGLAVSRGFLGGTIAMAIAANIGDTAIVDFDFCCPDSVVGIVAKAAGTEYLEMTLRFFQPKLVADAPETAQKNINLEVLRPMDVPCPPYDLQQRYGHIFRASYRVLERMAADTKHSITLFDALVEQAFVRGA